MANKTIKILAIDDQADNLVVLKALINDAFPEAHYISADSGIKGFELCQSERPDVILLDIVMPGMDGYEVCSKIKSDIRLKNIPVIMVTANRVDKESRVKALDAGADAFLPKPVDDSELKAQIRAMLRIKESEDQKKEEKQRLEDMVLDRTEALEIELADRKKAENKLIQSLDKITKNRQAIMNLMNDLTAEIEERKIVEHDLKEERNLLRTVIDNIHDTIYVFDKDCRKIIANKADVEITGCESEEDILGKTDLEVYPGETGKRFYSDSMNVITSGKPKIDNVEQFINKYGETKYLTTTQYPLHDTNGQCIGLVGIGHDITNRKIAEQELETKNKELSFLNSLAFELTQLTLADDINEFLAKKIKEFSGATVAVSFDYIPEKKAIQIRHIETKRELINKISKTLGMKFFETLIPVPDENLEFIVNEYFEVTNSLSDLSFGYVSDFAEKFIKKVTGIDRFYAIANVIGGEFYGSTMLGFKEGTVAPRKEVLVAYSRLAATTIQSRKSEEKLKESEEKYRLLIENQGEGVGIVDLNEKFVFVNPAAEEMFGVPKGGLVNRSLLEFVKKEYIPFIKEETKKRIKAEKSSYEINIIHPTGEQRTILITATPQFMKGKLSGTFGVFRDITDRRIMEQKIIESEAYYRTLVDISPDGIVISNLEGNVAYGSKKALEIFGVPPGDDVTGTSILSWLAPDSQSAIMERVMEIMKGNIAPETREYKLKKYDGTIFWGEISSSPLTDKNGNPSSLIIVCRDISERKKAEIELIYAKDKAEESDRLKTAFLHNISHEIRTPMNAIIGFSALLNEPDLDKQSQGSYTDVITQSSNHLLTIVSDIIEISNIEAGLIKISTKTTNLNPVMQSIYNQFSNRAAEKGLDFEIRNELSDNEAVIKTDEYKLTHVISSLISNAIKFTAKGKILLGYKLINNVLEFYVSDTGIGISQEHHVRIFDRFFQVESTTARQYEGTGLGLSISKAYVELMGGKIWLTSVPGEGSTFFFSIPYEPNEELLRTEEKSVFEGKHEVKGRKTILVAEDEENNFLLIRYVLSKLDLNILHARNGKEAVDICKSGNEIDLIIMDIKMPVMDGYEATTILKKLRPTIPVIAQTAFAFDTDREKALNAGCDDYLAKPVKKEMLIEMVKKYLQ